MAGQLLHDDSGVGPVVVGAVREHDDGQPPARVPHRSALVTGRERRERGVGGEPQRGEKRLQRSGLLPGRARVPVHVPGGIPNADHQLAVPARPGRRVRT
ncbi:hypothetical protein [Streptomyces barringtoniae]|uniref:hypothetical protein n=1 Tax=Streptomyces barringtoniae TaxID=2892029 RepID=UPI001E45BD16|nr:hypothetical protein [Streptomyces barringtoniae]MCC5474516.1 hypothetical protein [Streptomyces barringtoniae]